MAGTNEYQVTARKWRPNEFSSVVGQEHVTQTLRNAIRNRRLHHAYLFSGPRGVGKTTTARILAKALNCQNPGPEGEPCNVCESCVAITEGRSMDVVEIDGASNNSVDDVRALRDNAKYPPVIGSYKLYIIDEVHMLSTSAFNALLKTLEEPPKHLIFVFATTEPHKVLPTILSRCQRFDFRRMAIEDIVARLRYIADREGMKPEDDALIVIARKADGSMRDAQSIFDQVVAFCGTDFTYVAVNDALNVIDGEFYFRVTDMMRGHDTGAAFAIVDEIMRSGYDPGEFLLGLAEHFRNLLSVLTTGSGRLIETTSSIRERYEKEAAGYDQADIIRALHLVLGTQAAMRQSSGARLRLELLLIRLAVMDSSIRLTELLDAIKGMPEGPATGVAVREPSAGYSSGSSPIAGAAGSNAVSSSSTPASSLDRSADLFPKTNEESEAGRPEIPDPDYPSGDPGEAPTAPLRDASSADPDAGVSTAIEEDRSARKRDSIASFESFPTKMPSGGNRGATALAPPNGSGDTALLEAPAISIDEIRSRWSTFLEYCQDRPTIFTPLSHTVPAEMHGSVVRIYVESEYWCDLINASAAAVVEKLRSFFKINLNIESVIGQAPVRLAMNGNGVANGHVNGATHPEESHPFIQGIIEFLGATRVGP